MKTFQQTLDPAEVVFFVICHPEQRHVRGNAMHSDCEAYDRKVEDSVIAGIERGNAWAWCCIEVRAEWGGLAGVDYLGCCSYESEAAFEADGYYASMKAEALDDLMLNLSAYGWSAAAAVGGDNA